MVHGAGRQLASRALASGILSCPQADPMSSDISEYRLANQSLMHGSKTKIDDVLMTFEYRYIKVRMLMC
jgi:hypothetical protein